jgi:hypothetical protein
MNNFELLQYINFVLNKDRQGNTISSPEYEIMLQATSVEYFRELVRGYELNLINTNSVKRFKSTANIVVTTGIGDLPADYEYHSASLFTYQVNGDPTKWKKIDIVTDEEWDARISSSIKYPTQKNPIGKIVGDKIHILPLSIQAFRLAYLRTPNVPEFAMTLDQDDVEVYDDQNSVELDFEEFDKLKIAQMILSYRGVNLRDVNIVQYAEAIKEKQ